MIKAFVIQNYKTNQKRILPSIGILLIGVFNLELLSSTLILK